MSDAQHKRAAAKALQKITQHGAKCTFHKTERTGAVFTKETVALMVNQVRSTREGSPYAVGDYLFMIPFFDDFTPAVGQVLQHPKYGELRVSHTELTQPGSVGIFRYVWAGR